jgi:hypothetical protein
MTDRQKVVRVRGDAVFGADLLDRLLDFILERLVEDVLVFLVDRLPVLLVFGLSVALGLDVAAGLAKLLERLAVPFPLLGEEVEGRAGLLACAVGERLAVRRLRGQVRFELMNLPVQEPRLLHQRHQPRVVKIGDIPQRFGPALLAAGTLRMPSAAVRSGRRGRHGRRGRLRRGRSLRCGRSPDRAIAAGRRSPLPAFLLALRQLRRIEAQDPLRDRREEDHQLPVAALIAPRGAVRFREQRPLPPPKRLFPGH